MTTPVTAADLAVGQVWSGVTGHAESIVCIANGRVETQCECGEGVNRSIDEFVAWLEFTPKSRLLTAPPPVPHPAALADLYAALRGMLDSYIQLKQISLYIARSDAPNWIGRDMTPEDDVHVIAARAALAKAGGK